MFFSLQKISNAADADSLDHVAALLKAQFVQDNELSAIIAFVSVDSGMFAQTVTVSSRTVSTHEWVMILLYVLEIGCKIHSMLILLISTV